MLAQSSWDEALALGEKHGFRNAQTSVIAPTGTIGLVMDCDTTGIEPDIALVKYKQLAGGGMLKIVGNDGVGVVAAMGVDVCDRLIQPSHHFYTHDWGQILGEIGRAHV